MGDKASEDELQREWERKEQWYARAVNYWDQQAATVDGVLGGYGHVSPADIRESERFLLRCFGKRLKAAGMGEQPLVALDCGSGVGRIAEQLLLQHFQEVDLIEPSEHLLQTAKQNLAGPNRSRKFPAAHRAVNFFQMGLQDFTPEPQRYDVFWVQWCLMYLTDDDVLEWLARCSSSLRPGGLIVVKENLSTVSRYEIDQDDASVARSDDYLRELFKKAELKLLYSAMQKGFDEGLLKVRMYALRPLSMM